MNTFFLGNRWDWKVQIFGKCIENNIFKIQTAAFPLHSYFCEQNEFRTNFFDNNFIIQSTNYQSFENSKGIEVKENSNERYPTRLNSLNSKQSGKQLKIINNYEKNFEIPLNSESQMRLRIFNKNSFIGFDLITYSVLYWLHLQTATFHVLIDAITEKNE